MSEAHDLRDSRDPTKLGELLLKLRADEPDPGRSLATLYEIFDTTVESYEETALGPIEKYGDPRKRTEG